MTLRTRSARELGPAKPIQTPAWVDEHELIYLASPGAGIRNQSLKDPSDAEYPRRLVFRSGQPAVAAGDSSAGRPAVLSPAVYRATVMLVNVSSGIQRALHPDVDIPAPHLRKPPVSVSPQGRHAAYLIFKGFAGPISFETQYDVYVVALDGRSRPRRVASDVVIGEYGGGFAWSADGEHVTWTSGEEEAGRVWVYSVNASAARVLRGDPRDGGYGMMKLTSLLRGPGVLWLDNRRVVTTAYRGEPGTPWWKRLPTQLVVLDAELGTVVGRREVSPHGIASLVGRVRETVTLVVQDPSHKPTFYNVNVRSWRVQPVFKVPSGTIEYDVPNLPMISQDGEHIYYVGQDFAHPASIYRRFMPGGTTEKLMDPNPGLAAYAVGSARLLSYETSEGAPRKAALFLPPVWLPGRRVPLVVIVYPCICMSWRVHHFAGDGGGIGDIGSNVHLFTTRGFGVVMPDINTVAGRAMTDIHREALAAVDAAVREGYADSTRLGVTGHSYGGYGTYSLIAQSNRFRAAVVQAGLVNWTTNYLDIDDKGEGQGLMQAESSPRGPGGTLWENRSGYIANSPLFFLDRVRTPVLIVHGTLDGAVNQHEARMAFAALRRLGRDAELVLYVGEHHGMSDWSMANLQDFGTRMLRWFDRHLCPDRTSDFTCPATPLQPASRPRREQSSSRAY